MMFTYMKMIGKTDAIFKGKYFYVRNKNGRQTGLYHNCPIDNFGEFNSIIRFGKENKLIETVTDLGSNKRFRFSNFTEETLHKLVDKHNKKHFMYGRDIKLDKLERIDNSILKARYCSVCGKDITHRHKRSIYCVECSKKRQRQQTLKRQKDITQAKRDFKSGKITRCQLYYKTHKDYFRVVNKEYREKNKEYCDKLNKKYREEHPEKLKDWSAKYREEHKEVIVLCKTPCRKCGEVFILTQEDCNPKYISRIYYCSDDCKRLSRNEQRRMYKKKWRDKRRDLGLKVV